MSSKDIVDNLLRRADRASVDFLMLDTETALSFLDAARMTSHEEVRARRIREAHKAYTMIADHLQGLATDEEQSATLAGRLAVLRARLIQQGALSTSSPEVGTEVPWRSKATGTGFSHQRTLTCWKDIAKFFGKGVRTVQRWERLFGLPVRRPAGSKPDAIKSPVVADVVELAAWLQTWNERRKNQDISQTAMKPSIELTSLFERAGAAQRDHQRVMQDLRNTIAALRQTRESTAQGAQPKRSSEPILNGTAPVSPPASSLV